MPEAAINTTALTAAPSTAVVVAPTLAPTAAPTKTSTLMTSILAAIKAKERTCEPLLMVTDDRFLFNPNTADELHLKHRFVDKIKSLYWTPEEVPMSQDKKDFESMSLGEKKLIKNVLAFFASADTIIAENLAANFMREVQSPMARAFYGFQIANEIVHAETYANMTKNLVPDDKEQDHLMRAMSTVPTVKVMTDWARKWMDADLTFAERLVAFACVEGVFFAGAFCIIFYFRDKNKLKHGLGVANEFISRDETLHCEFACTLYKKHLVNKLPAERVHQIVAECVDSGQSFIEDALPEGLIGMSAPLLQRHVKFCADLVLMDLGCPPLYHCKNPFLWMEKMGLLSKSNFFEKRTTEYSRPDSLTLDDSSLFTGAPDF